MRPDPQKVAQAREWLKRARAAIESAASIEALAHLGEHSFEDPAAAGAFVALFVLARSVPTPEHRITAFRLVGPKSPEEKDAILREAIAALASKRGAVEEVRA